MFRKIIIYISTVLIAILSLPFLLLCKIVNNKEFSLKCINIMCKLINFCSGNNINLVNKQVLLMDKPYMIVANHLSFYDILSLMSFIPKPVFFIAKYELSKILIASSWFNTQRTVYVKREDKDSRISSLKQIMKKMKQKQNIGVFPAGTRSTKNLPFQDGLINLAIKNKYIIIPLTIKNTNLVLEDRHNNKTINTEFIFHDPINTTNLNISNEALVKELENIVYEKK